MNGLLNEILVLIFKTMNIIWREKKTKIYQYDQKL